MEQVMPNKNDISSYANFDKIVQEHIELDVYIDFAKEIITGKVKIKFNRIDKSETKIVLDTKCLNIQSIKDEQSNKSLSYNVVDNHQYKDAIGSPLIINLDETSQESSVTIVIEYSTTEGADAVQWLKPSQTLSKKHPFMFTQGEAILTRTYIPCQDTPSAKVTVRAILKVDLPLTALFAGVEDSKMKTDDNKIVYIYKQSIAVPTYLIAIAAGELEYGKISERCGIFTEMGLAEKAVWEFQDTETYLKAAEEYLTPYVWGVYNILVLPQAFPYGGMENPCLTFVTPALIAGDRSMTNVIAHEISHSWTGNLVTNKDWSNFWVNEGFTTFMERKLCELVYGEELSNLEARVGQDELKYAINSYGEEHNFTKLAPDFTGIDPDDAFSVVPYEKGYTLLYFIETIVGKANFQKILQSYIKEFSHKSVSHEAFKSIFEREVKVMYGDSAEEKVLSKVDWEAWLNKPGYPIVNFEYSK